MLGGSTNSGDIKSLSSKFEQNSVETVDFSLLITSNVLLKEVRDLKIFKKNGDIREPRTQIEVNDAARLIQQSWKHYKI